MSKGRATTLIPGSVDPRRMAKKRISLQGTVQSEAMPRLLKATHKVGEITAKVGFSVDEHYRPRVSGKVESAVELICQRCLAPSQHHLEANFDLAVVQTDEQAANLPADIDPWLASEGEVDFFQVLEQELLLALPLVAYHNYECVESVAFDTSEGHEEMAPVNKNPFDVLANLKTK